MTAPHVIERLKNEDDWFIIAKNDHEVALIHDYLLGVGRWSKLVLCQIHLKCAVAKADGYIDQYDYSQACDLVSEYFKNLTEWFFQEVNNY